LIDTDPDSDGDTALDRSLSNPLCVFARELIEYDYERD